MSARRSARILAVASGVALPLSAQAQTADHAQAIWEYFAETCAAVVAADSPAVFAARLPGTRGGAGQSADESLAMATAELEGVAPEGDFAILTAMVNVFEGGRSVQCIIQLPQPTYDLTGLSDIARDRAAEILGADVVIAGGRMNEIRMADGIPEGIGDSTTYLRASTGGFPPDAVIMVQVMPVFASLTLSVTQADAAE